jgi:hypothetical protein
MPDPPVTPPPPPEAPAASDQPTNFDISEEYGTARKNLPPAGIVAISVAVVVAIAAVYALTHRAHARSTGAIDDVVAVPMPGQNMVMVAVNVSLQNNELKPTWIKSIKVAAEVGGNKLSDEAAPAVDSERYFQAMPELKQHARNLLTPEMRVDPGGRLAGTVVASFPVKAEQFATRKSLTVIITPYDELPITMTK